MGNCGIQFWWKLFDLERGVRRFTRHLRLSETAWLLSFCADQLYCRCYELPRLSHGGQRRGWGGQQGSICPDPHPRLTGSQCGQHDFRSVVLHENLQLITSPDLAEHRRLHPRDDQHRIPSKLDFIDEPMAWPADGNIWNPHTNAGSDRTGESFESRNLVWTECLFDGLWDTACSSSEALSQ